LFMDKFYLITICDDVRFGLINVDFKWTHPRTISYYVSCPRLLWKLNDDSRHKLSQSTYDFVSMKSIAFRPNRYTVQN
jgi:hypothetical protein